MRAVVRLAPVLVAVVFGVSGCQRLNFEKTTTLTGVSSQQWSFDPPSYAQKLTVSVSPQKGPVSAYLVKGGEEEANAVDTALNANKPPPSGAVLGSRVSKDKAEDYSFEVEVPAKTGYTLLLRSEKSTTDVKVKVVGK